MLGVVVVMPVVGVVCCVMRTQFTHTYKLTRAHTRAHTRTQMQDQMGMQPIPLPAVLTGGIPPPPLPDESDSR